MAVGRQRAYAELTVKIGLNLQPRQRMLHAEKRPH